MARRTELRQLLLCPMCPPRLVRALAPFAAIVDVPANNIYVRAHDIIYVFRELQTFVFGAVGVGAGGRIGQSPPLLVRGARDGQFPRSVRRMPPQRDDFWRSRRCLDGASRAQAAKIGGMDRNPSVTHCEAHFEIVTLIGFVLFEQP
jgi:hypothetical protein